MVEDRLVEDVLGAASLQRVGDLLVGLVVEAHHRFDGNAAVVVGADNARMVLVYRARAVYRVIDDIVVEFVLFDRAVDVVVVHQIAARWVDEAGVGAHGCQLLIKHNGGVPRPVQRAGVADLEKFHRVVYGLDAATGSQLADVRARVVHQETAVVSQQRLGPHGHLLADAADTGQRQQAACEALKAGHDEVALIPVIFPNLLYGISNQVDWPGEPHPVYLYFIDNKIGLK